MPRKVGYQTVSRFDEEVVECGLGFQVVSRMVMASLERVLSSDLRVEWVPKNSDVEEHTFAV